MGEWSKSLGEKGEKILKFVFEEILGINSLEENKSIGCFRNEKHKRKQSKKDRETHGVDGLYYMDSPLEDELLDVILISSKYTHQYPKYPRGLFVSHLEDLAQTIECFQYSKENNRVSQLFNNVTKTNYTGVIVWLSNSDPVNFELIPKLSKTQIPNDVEFEKLIVLDNARVNFLYQTIYKTKKERSSVEFVYHDTSLNTRSLNSQAYGDRFPVNYLYSDIIILRVEENGVVEFLIFINDDFNSDVFNQVLAFSKYFDHLNAIDKTTVHYLNYDNVSNENQVKSALINYSNFSFNQNLIVTKFPQDFRQ